MGRFFRAKVTPLIVENHTELGNSRGCKVNRCEVYIYDPPPPPLERSAKCVCGVGGMCVCVCATDHYHS